jgi:DNA-binding IclR family transcriptional regulator
LRAYTEHTVTDPGRLRKVLAEVRRTGSVVCPGHIHLDAAGVAVPVRDADGVVDAALGVVVPNDGTARRTVPALLTAALGIQRIRASLSR